MAFFHGFLEYLVMIVKNNVPADQTSHNKVSIFAASAKFIVIMFPWRNDANRPCRNSEVTSVQITSHWKQ